MVKTYVFGHKSPDSDSITSSLVMTNLEKELGNTEVQAYRLGNINKETEFILNYLDYKKIFYYSYSENDKKKNYDVNFYMKDKKLVCEFAAIYSELIDN